VLASLSSVATMMLEKGDGPLPDNDPSQPRIVKTLRRGGQVRAGGF